MNEHLEDDDAVLSRGERELTLSTGAILGIFLGLVLLCGVCFGVGYNMGRKSLPTPLALNDNSGNSNETLSADTSSNAKPAPGSPLDNGTPAAQPAPAVIAPPAPAPKPAPIVRKPPPALDTDAGTPAASSNTSARTTEPSATPAPRIVSPSALMPGATSTAPLSGSFVVQVAAVSHREDADLLVSALRARGYAVTARQGLNDGFIHVQVGPFSSKPAAEAMRQRLLADGYNAILK